VAGNLNVSGVETKRAMIAMASGHKFVDGHPSTARATGETGASEVFGSFSHKAII
jgi:hypothetical protein